MYVSIQKYQQKNRKVNENIILNNKSIKIRTKNVTIILKPKCKKSLHTFSHSAEKASLHYQLYPKLFPDSVMSSV